jgi:endonuclease/exonuclease/phosphatase (EEP) superfamily protein YafD
MFKKFPEQSLQRICNLAEIGTFLTVGCTFFSLLERSFWVFELLVHFRVQYFCLLSMAAMVLLFNKRWKWAILAITFSAWNASSFIPYYCPSREVGLANRVEIKIAAWNVLTSNTRYEEVLQEIEAQNPDLLLLLEINETWVQKIGSLKASYPYSIIEPREDNFGIGLFSKMPFKHSLLEYFEKVPSVYAQLELGSTILNVVATHTLPPISQEWSFRRNQHLEKVANFVSKLVGECVVMGDLNVSPYSIVFKDFIKSSKLRDSAKGFGVQNTWKTSTPWVAIPIDHILVSSGLQVNNRIVSGSHGSDHSLIMATVQVLTM